MAVVMVGDTAEVMVAVTPITAAVTPITGAAISSAEAVDTSGTATGGATA